MSKFKQEEIKKKVGKTVYLQEGVRKLTFTNDFLENGNVKKEEKLKK